MAESGRQALLIERWLYAIERKRRPVGCGSVPSAGRVYSATLRRRAGSTLILIISAPVQRTDAAGGTALWAVAANHAQTATQATIRRAITSSTPEARSTYPDFSLAIVRLSAAITLAGSSANSSSAANCWPSPIAYSRNCRSAAAFGVETGTIA